MSATVDVERYEQYFRQHFSGLVALGVAATGDRELAHDLAQESFERLASNWSSVQAYDNVGAWLRRVMANRLIDMRRSRAAEQRALAKLRRRRDNVGQPSGNAADDWYRLVQPLPTRQRVIVALFYGEDTSIATIASMLGITEGTVKSSIAKARRSMRRRLETQDV